jgi:tetratricopeptide (TPR) repeat protein
MELGTTLCEEGASVVTDCKNLVPQLYLRHAKELAAGGEGPASLPILDKAAKTAAAYGDQTGIQAEVNDLKSKVYYIIANEAFGKKEFALAIENYRKVLELDPANGIAYLRLGQASANSGLEDEAVAALEKAAELGQEDNARRLMGFIYLKKAVGAQKNKDWEQVYQQTTYNPTNCWAWPPWS